jgi:hypothetical protein
MYLSLQRDGGNKEIFKVTNILSLAYLPKKFFNNFEIQGESALFAHSFIFVSKTRPEVRAAVPRAAKLRRNYSEIRHLTSPISESNIHSSLTIFSILYILRIMVFYQPGVTTHNLPRDPFKVRSNEAVFSLRSYNYSHVWFRDL